MSAAAFPAPLLKPRIRLPVPAARWVALDVSDTGVGIPPEHMEKIFDPFFTTKPKGKGTGLGLAISYSIVKRHNGLILVESRIGHGSRFRILLPVPDAAPGPAPLPAPAAAAGPAPAAGGRGETVLVVDDEKTVRGVLTRILERNGYKVVLAEDGAEGVEKYKANRDAVDLVILDIAMPRMNGNEAYGALMEVNPKLKVLVSSGYSEEDRVADLMGRGANGFLRKPYESETVLAAVRDVLDS
jgi:two-component system cell cycle sensor histidine kinase/response regulator CckA